MSAGGFLKHFGFALPLSIVGFDEGMRGVTNPVRDSLPGMGFCALCKRTRTVTYLRGDGQRVCSIDIEETLNSKTVTWRSRFGRRRILPDCPEEKVSDEMWADKPWWDRQFT